MFQRRFSPVFIIASFLVSVVLTLLASGYINLWRAEQAQAQGSSLFAAESYLQAARFLFWRSDLNERAGIAYAKAGEFSKTTEIFKQHTPISEEGWVWFCTAHIQLGQIEQALVTCNAGLEADESAALYRLLAFIHRGQKDWEQEHLALIGQTRLDPGDAFAAYRLGLLLTLSAPEEALPELTRASTLNPEVDSAVQTLRAALAVASQQSDPSRQKVIVGQAFGLVQEWQLALTAFEQATQLDEENAEAWAWLGEAKQQTGQDGSADLYRAFELDNSSINVLTLRALFWSRSGNFEAMLADYQLAAEIEPRNPRWQAGVGEAHAKLGNLVSALEAYQRAVELAPDDPLYWRLLAIFCAENGVQQEEVGLPAAQQALSLAPNDPAALDALGFVYLSTGRYASAQKTLLSATQLAPDYFPAHLHLAMTYLAQGNQADAFNSLTFVRDADASGAYAQTAQQLLDKYFR